MIHYTHFQTFLKIPKNGQKFQFRDEIPKSESNDKLAWKCTGWLMLAHTTHASAFSSEEEMG